MCVKTVDYTDWFWYFWFRLWIWRLKWKHAWYERAIHTITVDGVRTPGFDL